MWLIPHSKSEKCEKIHKYAFSFEDQISMNLGFVQPWGILLNHAEYLASALTSALQSSY